MNEEFGPILPSEPGDTAQRKVNAIFGYLLVDWPDDPDTTEAVLRATEQLSEDEDISSLNREQIRAAITEAAKRCVNDKTVMLKVSKIEFKK